MSKKTPSHRILEPPCLAGMTKLDKNLFLKNVELPYLEIPASWIGKLIGLKSLKEVLIKKNGKFKPFMNSKFNDKKLLIFDPDVFITFSDPYQIILEIKKVIDSSEVKNLTFKKMMHCFTYEDWEVKSCLKSILPQNIEFSGFAQVGHIAHLNLRENLLPYKFVIAEILLDKISWVKTVVNKLNAIDHEFRFFEMELLAGIPEYITTVIEQGIKYSFDFSKVFWNSRLTKVHDLIINKFNENSVVFDVFAGVGPFVIPAIKLKNAQKCFANDLNPESIRYLNENILLNKISKNRIETFNCDGAEFIKEIISLKFFEFFKENKKEKLNFHVVMNLPCLAVDFLRHFKGFLNRYSETRDFFNKNSFIVHCHLFVKGHESHSKEWFQNEAERLVKDQLFLPELDIIKTQYIRKVAAFKEMFCVTFSLPHYYVYLNNEFNLCTKEFEKNLRKRNIDLVTKSDCDIKVIQKKK